MTSQQLLNHLKRNPFVLAPMAGITDSAFRSCMRELGCGIVVSELVSAHGIRFKSEKTLRLMQFNLDQRPVGIQVFGENPDILTEAARFVEDQGACFVDLNLGCPVPKVVKKGAGSALLKDPLQLAKVLREMRRATSIPLTIKIRTGWDENHRNADEVVRIAAEEGVTWVAIHGRTRAAGYSGRADWEYIAKVKQSAVLPIIGNGDITSGQQAARVLLQSGCDGVMIGRGCLKNPVIFLQAQQHFRIANGLKSPEPLSVPPEEILRRLHFWMERQYEERICGLQLRKFASWYSSGYPQANQFRKALFQTQGIENVMRAIETFFVERKDIQPRDTSSEPFLMGGHG